MLKTLLPLAMLLPTAFIAPKNFLWQICLSQGFLVAFLNLHSISWASETGWWNPTQLLACDPLSAPLIALSCWLLPLTFLASMNHLSAEPLSYQRTYIFTLTCLQALLVLAFCSTEMIMFFMVFEATLLPTLLIITRWGNQAERLNAGTYLLFYTMTGSLPLLIALLTLQNHVGSLSLFTLNTLQSPALLPSTEGLFWLACFAAFLVKMPLYGVHLWLPKAHVEAPIAGSMILAALLLKLGGYGMMRISPILSLSPSDLAYPLIALALWGVVMTGSLCLRQTDLKSLIAYSSVSHMGLVTAAILIQTPWSFSGATLLMLAHGLTSSALFCLANTSYERNHTRTLALIRGMQALLPLMTAWWLFASLANLALPPLPNLISELLVISALFSWSFWTLALTGAGTIITATYSLHLFLSTQQGPSPQHVAPFVPSHTREHLLLALHLFPLLFLTLKPEMAWGWCL